MWWAILKCVGGMFVSAIIALCWVSNSSAWSLTKSPDFQTSGVKMVNQNPCPESFELISVSGEGQISACVMGSGVRVASYFPAQGGVSYAISFPYEATFYRLDVCGGTWGCVYAERNDTFAGLSFGYKHFAAHLKKSIQNGVIHYTPSEDASFFIFNQFGHLTLSGQSVAVSKNGEWIVFEAREYGIFRVEVRTLEITRFIAPGFQYGYGYDPRAELAISNDGTVAGVVGQRVGLRMVVINETCGDHPNEYMQPQYVGAITPCPYLNTPTDHYISGFAYALSPRFSEDDKVFSFTAFSSNTSPARISLFSDPTSLDKVRYVAIGDSFTSGEGELNDQFYIGGASNHCHVSSRSYPFLLAQLWNIEGHNEACSGATIDAARAKAPSVDQTNQLAELETLLPKVTTVGIGGNDAGLMGKLKTCLGLDTCEWAGTSKGRAGTALEIKNVHSRLKDFYKDVKLRTSGVVIAVGYPKIISSGPECPSSIGLLLNQTERTFMNESVHYLNQAIQAAANAAEVEFANTEDAFLGGELCASAASSLMNGIRFGDDMPLVAALPALKVIGAESFHPTPAGHSAVARKIVDAFPSPEGLDLCESCTGSSSVPTPGAYWQGLDIPTHTPKAVSFLKKITIKKQGSFEISFPAFSFEPSSDVTVELHSEARALDVARAAEDGSLSLTLQAPSGETGYHSVHILGNGFTGEKVDAYDFLAIEDETAFSGASIQSSGSTNNGSKAAVVTTDTHQRSQNSAEVLGLSVANSTAPIFKNQQAEIPTQRASQTNLAGKIWAVIAGLGVLLCTGILVGYIFYKQKQSRNRDG